jgi:large subunit ribosomal protein L31e
MAKSKSKTSNKVEREYIIPLRKAKMVPKWRRTKRAVKEVKKFLVRHMKIYDRDLNKVKLDKWLNERLWMRGMKNPPSKIKVKAVREGGEVKVELVKIPEELKWKMKKSKEAKKKAEKEKKEKKKKEEKKESEEDKEKEKEKEELVKQEEIEKARKKHKTKKHVSNIQKAKKSQKAGVSQRKALEK